MLSAFLKALWLLPAPMRKVSVADSSVTSAVGPRWVTWVLLALSSCWVGQQRLPKWRSQASCVSTPSPGHGGQTSLGVLGSAQATFHDSCLSGSPASQGTPSGSCSFSASVCGLACRSQEQVSHF